MSTSKVILGIISATAWQFMKYKAEGNGYYIIDFHIKSSSWDNISNCLAIYEI